MAKKPVSELSGSELDYWVGKTESLNVCIHDGRCILNLPYDVIIGPNDFVNYNPTQSPMQMWPIIERENLTVSCNRRNATCWSTVEGIMGGVSKGETGLIAAARYFVASVYGEYVEVE